MILVLLLLGSATSIVIPLRKPKTFCLSKYVSDKETVHLGYMVTGEIEDSINVTLKVHEGRELWSEKGMHQGETEQQIEGSSQVDLCFTQTVEADVYVDFNFLADTEEMKAIKDMAKDDELIKMTKHVSNMTILHEDIQNHVRYLHERKRKHYESLLKLKSKLNKYCYVKIGFIFLISIAQLVIAISLFSNRAKRVVENIAFNPFGEGNSNTL